MWRLFMCGVLAFSFSVAQAEMGAPSVAGPQSNLWDSSNPSGSATHITPVIGLSATGMKSSTNDLDSRTAVALGLYAELGTSLLTFQTGLLYWKGGGKYEGAAGSLSVGLDYLSVPVFAKLNFFGNPDRTVYLKIGALPSVLIGKTATDSSGAVRGLGEKSFDLPIVVGLGGSMPISETQSLTFEANYMRSLTDAIKMSNGTSYKNDGLLLLIGMTLAI